MNSGQLVRVFSSESPDNSIAKPVGPAVKATGAKVKSVISSGSASSVSMTSLQPGCSDICERDTELLLCREMREINLPMSLYVYEGCSARRGE